MGKLVYENSIRVDIDDRALTHLQLVVGRKLRRGESCFFSWREDVSLGGGRNSIWLHPQSSLHFKFLGSREPALNEAWLRDMAVAANSPRGLYVVPEPVEDAALTALEFDRDQVSSI
jgi:hypothetical protein